MAKILYSELPSLVTTKDLRKYFLEHVYGVKGSGTLYVVHERLLVFKKVHSKDLNFDRIANLILRPGTVIHAPVSAWQYGEPNRHDKRKMRASMAYIDSIADSETGRLINSAVSEYDNSFKYVVDKTVFPEYSFDTSSHICTSGIHFYLNVKDAYNN